jgi:DNA (cytosine-5)-methyltransferase 1
MKRKLVAIDLFAGCGGLTVGMKNGGFRVAAAVEVNEVAAETYRANHRSTKMFQVDICDVSPRVLRRSAAAPIALIAGCAPCQGFCSLTEKVKREDPRNQLVLQMSRLVEELRPTAVFMENVPGLLTRGQAIFEEFVARLNALGYLPQWKTIQMADYGVPQSRRRLVLLAGRGFAIPFPEATHSKRGDGELPHWATVRETIGHMRAAKRLSAARRDGSPLQEKWHVVRDLQPQTRDRLRVAMPGKTWLEVPESVRPHCHQEGYVGFTNVYGRMSWDRESPTITTGCTTPAKGRFGHPDRRRTTISVREAALLQTFSEDYVFKSEHIDQVCGMIGNAVPPLFAAIAASTIRDAIERHEQILKRPRR